MITGPFGSGKSIVAFITIQNYLESNKESQAYFIVFDELSSFDEFYFLAAQISGSGTQQPDFGFWYPAASSKNTTQV